MASKTWAEWKNEFAKLEAEQERAAYEAEMRRDEVIERHSQAEQSKPKQVTKQLPVRPPVEDAVHLASNDAIVTFQAEGEVVHVTVRKRRHAHQYQTLTREAARKLWQDYVAQGFRRW